MAGQGSARVTLKEIDLSQVNNPQQQPQGVPAAVVGPARKGPAFVPRTFANIRQFSDTFGDMLEVSKDSNSNLFGPLALDQWLRNANAGTYIRTLGIGDGSKDATDAGFVVGSQQVQRSGGSKDKVAKNLSSTGTGLGRTMMLGSFMKDSASSKYLQDAGVQTGSVAAALVIDFDAVPANSNFIILEGVNANGVRRKFKFLFVSGADENTIDNTSGGAGALAYDTLVNVGVNAVGVNAAATRFHNALSGVKVDGNTSLDGIQDAFNPSLYFDSTDDQASKVSISQVGTGDDGNTLSLFDITEAVTITGSEEKTAGELIASVNPTLSNATPASIDIVIDGAVPRVIQQAKTTITISGEVTLGEEFTVNDGSATQTFRLVDEAADGVDGNVIKIGITNGFGAQDAQLAVINHIRDSIFAAVDAGGVITNLTVSVVRDDDKFDIETTTDVQVDIVSDLSGIQNLDQVQSQKGGAAADVLTVKDILGRTTTFTFDENNDDNFEREQARQYRIGIQTQAQKVYLDGDDEAIIDKLKAAIEDAVSQDDLVGLTTTEPDENTISIESINGLFVGFVAEATVNANAAIALANEDLGSDGSSSTIKIKVSGDATVDNEFTLNTMNKTTGKRHTNSTFRFVANENGEGNGDFAGDHFKVEIPEDDSNIDILLSNIRHAILKNFHDDYDIALDLADKELTIVTEAAAHQGFVHDQSFDYKLNENFLVTHVGGESQGKFGPQTVSFTGGGGGAVPIIRGILMLPEGVVASLDQQTDQDNANNAHYNKLTDYSDTSIIRSISNNVATNFGNNDQTNGRLAGYVLGEVSNNAFRVILNGFSNTSEPVSLDCSFNPNDSTYFANVLNTDPTKIEEKGHYLYAHWDVHTNVSEPSNQGLVAGAGGNLVTVGEISNSVGILSKASGARNAANEANYEGFDVRYQTAKTPWFVSQYYSKPSHNVRYNSDGALTLSSGEAKKLFRLHMLDDGVSGNEQLRVLISGIRAGRSGTYGSFDLTLELFDGDSVSGTAVAGWKNLNFDPDSNNYIERVIGNQHTYYNFDGDNNRQRLVTEGIYPLRNKYVRVEVSDGILNGSCPVSALPAGFRGLTHLKTQGQFVEPGDEGGSNKILADGSLDNLQVAPLNFVKSISRKLDLQTPTWEVSPDLAWGIKFASKTNPDLLFKENSELTHNSSIRSWTKYLPASVSESDSQVADSFQNNFFSLEKIAVKRAQTDGTDNTIDWNQSTYSRNGQLPSGAGEMGVNTFVDFEKDANNLNARYLKFRCLFQGGFDGLNIFDEDKSNQNNTAAYREANGEKGDNAVTGPTIMAYRKALDVLTDKSAVELQLLAIPGIREPQVTNYAITACEDRFDAMFIMDIQQVDESSEEILYDSIKPHVRNTIGTFEKRVLDTSFAAAYFPNVLVRRPSTGAPIEVPPSVCMLGVMSQNDSIADPWFAPAGLNRGRLNALNSNLQMNRDLLDELYDVDINPIYEPAGRPGEVYAFGQKTLLQDQSALDRVNVRRLLIDLRRKVKNVAQSLLFEPNRASTLQRFNSLVEPILADVKARQGVERYKVQIDSNTTTQNDIENNTIRGKIYLQPTKSVEFISLDFVVTNSID